MMTKKEMIKIMQEQETDRWERLQEFEDVFGNRNENTVQALCRWGTIYRLMEDLEIESNREEA